MTAISCIPKTKQYPSIWFQPFYTHIYLYVQFIFNIIYVLIVFMKYFTSVVYTSNKSPFFLISLSRSNQRLLVSTRAVHDRHSIISLFTRSNHRIFNIYDKYYYCRVFYFSANSYSILQSQLVLGFNIVFPAL